jgi:tetratricopeptide (TPR) repeat protein
VSSEDWDYKGKKIKNYIWDETSQTFITVVEEYDFEGARQKVERLIFQEHNYDSAILSIQQFLAEAPTEYLQTSYCELGVCQYHPQKYYPGMHYLMAIAYEMSGQPEQAARAYYILWRDYPDSPYALLAQNKLELVKP